MNRSIPLGGVAGVILCTWIGNVSLAQELASWNDGPAKTAITRFVARVTKTDSRDFVPSDQRIAVFDNDGTLWGEKPLYFQLAFALDRVKKLAAEHPETGRHYTEMVYQPMLELLAYLRSQRFKTWIVSGGGIEFMRPWSQRVNGIPAEQVVGSSIKVKFELRDGTPTLVRLPELDFIDDKAGKPVGIRKFIGRRPIAAFGNSNGNLQMIQWTTSGEGARFGLYVHDTDTEREFAYDKNSSVGRLDKGLTEAAAKGWTVVDRKQDWKVIYPPETKRQIRSDTERQLTKA